MTKLVTVVVKKYYLSVGWWANNFTMHCFYFLPT